MFGCEEVEGSTMGEQTDADCWACAGGPPAIKAAAIETAAIHITRRCCGMAG
jgi:hypothetical protein